MIVVLSLVDEQSTPKWFTKPCAQKGIRSVMHRLSLIISLSAVVLLILFSWLIQADRSGAGAASNNNVLIIKGIESFGSKGAPPHRRTGLAAITQPPSAGGRLDDKETSLTANEIREIAEMDSAPALEPRDAAWASYNEGRLYARVRELGIFDNGKTRVQCGRERCVLSVSTVEALTPLNLEAAMSSVSKIGASDRDVDSLIANRLYSISNDDKTVRFKVDLLRSASEAETTIKL